MDNLEKVFEKIMGSVDLKEGLAKALKNNTVQEFMKKLGVDEPLEKIMAFLKDKKFDLPDIDLKQASGLLGKLKGLFGKK